MAFERVEVGPETGKKTGGKTGGTDRREQLVATVRRWLEAKLCLVEVFRHQGRGGYVPALRYELHDDGVVDVEGVTVNGVNPFAFVDGLIEDVRNHAAERGNANYQIVGHHTVGEGDDMALEKSFTFTIPKSWIGELPDGDDTGGGESQVITLVGGYRSLIELQQRYIGDLQRANVSMGTSSAEVVKANAQTLLANAENIAQHAPAVELEMAKLEMEREAMRAEVQVRRDAGRHERNARMAERLIEVVGPDVVAAIRLLVAKWSGGAADGSDAASSAHATELGAILDACTVEQRSKLNEIFGADAWSVIESAAKADSDAAFGACWAKLNEIVGSWTQAEQTKTLSAVAVTIGNDLAARLMALFRNIR